MFFNTRSLFFTLILISIFASACNKDYGPVQETDIVFLGHRGGGNNGYNNLNMENTLPAIQEGLRLLDGVETDLQMSLDGTIWLFHDTDINEYVCEERPANSIIFMHDAEIAKINLCHGTKKARVYKLTELVDLWNSAASGFYMSLEIKTAWSNAEFDKIGGRDAYLLKFADQIAKDLVKMNHPGKLTVEIDSKLFCDRLRTYEISKHIKTCLIREGTLEKQINDALALGYNGISCNFTETTLTAENIKKAKSSGLFVQVWTPNYEEDLKSVFKMQPDVIQTDNLKAKRLLNVK